MSFQGTKLLDTRSALNHCYQGVLDGEGYHNNLKISVFLLPVFESDTSWK